MVRYEATEAEFGGKSSYSRLLWQLSMYSEILGGLLVGVSGLAMFTVLSLAEFDIVGPIEIIGLFLVTFGLWAYNVSERHWFGQFARMSFATMAAGTVITAIALPIADYGPGVAFFGFLLGLMITMVGALGFGVAMLRANAVPREAAWLLIAALPIGLPLAFGFTTYVMGGLADPWGGPLVFYGLAWVVFGRSLWARRAEI